MKIKAQNLIEFIVVIPILIIVILGIIEYSLFWNNVQIVQRIALKAAIGASSQYVDDSYTSSDMGNATFNPAALKAMQIVQQNTGSLGVGNITFSYLDPGSTYGQKPYSLYTFYSSQTRNTYLGTMPVMTLTVDYTDPYNQGVVTQLIYQYKSVFGGVEFASWEVILLLLFPRILL